MPRPLPEKLARWCQLAIALKIIVPASNPSPYNLASHSLPDSLIPVPASLFFTTSVPGVLSFFRPICYALPTKRAAGFPGSFSPPACPWGPGWTVALSVPVCQ
jgi:hypothetical protein